MIEDWVVWSFPPCKKRIPSSKWTRIKQLLHTRSEVNEAIRAAIAGDEEHYLEELMDIKHSNETSEREFTPIQVLLKIGDVTAKNAKRGYY